MAAGIKTNQRITRLTPLDDVLAQIDAKVKPAAARAYDCATACGSILAADILAPAALPDRACALRDGFAMDADATRDANSYAPLALPTAARFLSAGEAMPAATDAILPHEAIEERDARIDIVASVTPGDGVLAPGADAQAGAVLMRAGTQLRAHMIAALSAAGIHTVDVRKPRIAIAARRSDRFISAARDWLAHAIHADGGEVIACDGIAAALQAGNADAVMTIGGTGSGRDDDAVATLTRSGAVPCHGIAIAPGETAAFGFAQDKHGLGKHGLAKPVLLMPGRLDAVLSCWLLIGANLNARLSARANGSKGGRSATLARKVTSSLGITEIVPVALTEGDAEPLAFAYLSLQALARADGWICVPAQSEGYPAGSRVTVRAFP
jgi:molybdopterin biosynthesis enzyme